MISQILIRFWFLVTLSLWCGRNSFLGRWCWCCMHAKSSTSTALTSQIVQWCTAHMVFSSKSFYISTAVSCHYLYNTFRPALESLNPTIFNTINWVAGSMEWSSHQPSPRSAGQILRAVINDHMTCYNLNWPKIKLWVHYFVFSCALDHILKS